MGQILFPPNIISPNDNPVVFLAGPIQGAPNWQEQAIEKLLSLKVNADIASPRRPKGIESEFGLQDYYQQVDWETYYLNLAGNRGGVILFWLAAEQEHFCNRAFAQTSRFELGEWKERARRNEAKLVLGIADGFSNARYIRHRFSQDCPDVGMYFSLDDACEAVAKLL
jgi:hypothetical protein